MRNDMLSEQMKKANVFKHPSKPGEKQIKMRHIKGHYLAHQTYLTKRHNHFGNEPKAWWISKKNTHKRRYLTQLRQEELSQLQDLVPLTGTLANMFNNLLKNKKLSVKELLTYEKTIRRNLQKI